MYMYVNLQVCIYLVFNGRMFVYMTCTCLFDFACFFLPSLSSLIKTYMYRNGFKKCAEWSNYIKDVYIRAWALLCSRGGFVYTVTHAAVCKHTIYIYMCMYMYINTLAGCIFVE